MTHEELTELSALSYKINQHLLALKYIDSDEFDFKALDAFYHYCLTHKEIMRDAICNELEQLKEEFSSK